MTNSGQRRGSPGPFERLAEALRLDPLTRDERFRLRGFPGLDGSRGRTYGKAESGRDIGADAFLSIHHIKGWDPLTSRPADALMPKWRGGIVWPHIALAVRFEVECMSVSARRLAELARMPPVALHRVFHGQIVGVENLFRVCAYFDRHPHQITAGNPVSRGTLAETAAPAAAAE